LEILPHHEKIELLYRGSNDGFKFCEFENKFFNKEKTVLVIKSKEK
jgi:hypothetical protein